MAYLFGNIPPPSHSAKRSWSPKRICPAPFFLALLVISVFRIVHNTHESNVYPRLTDKGLGSPVSPPLWRHRHEPMRGSFTSLVSHQLVCPWTTRGRRPRSYIPRFHTLADLLCLLHAVKTQEYRGLYAYQGSLLSSSFALTQLATPFNPPFLLWVLSQIKLLSGWALSATRSLARIMPIH